MMGQDGTPFPAYAEVRQAEQAQRKLLDEHRKVEEQKRRAERERRQEEINAELRRKALETKQT